MAPKKPRRKHNKSVAKSGTRRKKCSAAELVFVDAIIAGDNQLTAARKMGMTEASARRHAHEVRNRPQVDAEITRRMAAATKRADVSRDDIVAEMKKLAFSNIGNYLTPDGDGMPAFRRIDQITPEHLAAIQDITVTTETDHITSAGKGDDDAVEKTTVKRVRFKLHDKLSALKTLGQHVGMFADDEKKNGGDTINNNTIIFTNAVSAADDLIAAVIAGGTGQKPPVAVSS